MMLHLISQLMRNLLGTHLGHSAIYNMCRLMEDRQVPGPGCPRSCPAFPRRLDLARLPGRLLSLEWLLREPP